MESDINLRPHIFLPLIDPFKLVLDYRDLLTYLTIRSYLNSATGVCYPALKTIEAKSGLSYRFLSDSIKRLKEADLLSIEPGHSNHYIFPKVDLFSSVPADFLSITELTTTEKAFVLCILKFFNGALIVPAKFSAKDVAVLTGLNIKTVKKHIETIIEKGYLKVYKQGFFQLTTKFDWNVYDHNSSEPETKSVIDRPVLIVK